MLDQIHRRKVTDIAVCGGEGCVAELLLDDRDRHAFRHQFIGVSMSQAVGVDALFDACLLREAG